MKITDTTYDELIMENVSEHFHELIDEFGLLGCLLIKAQMWQESRLIPTRNLLLVRVVDATHARNRHEIDGDIDAFDPAGNIENGVRYLADQYRRLAEIPHAQTGLSRSGGIQRRARVCQQAMSLGRGNEGLQLFINTGFATERREDCGRHGGYCSHVAA